MPVLHRLVLAAAATAALLVPAASAPAATWRTEPIPSQGVVALGDLAFAPDGTGLLSWEHIPPKRTALARRPSAAPGAVATWTTREVPGITWGSARVHPYGTTRTLLVATQNLPPGRFNRARRRLVTAFGHTDGSFGAFGTIASRIAQPVSAVDPAGDALVAWSPDDAAGVFVSERPAAHAFGHPRRLSATAPTALTVAIGARGDRVVAWSAGGRLYARVRRAGHSWGSVLRVADVDLRPNGQLRAEVNAAGTVTLAWETVDVRESRPVTLAAGVAVRRTSGGWRTGTLERSTVAAAPEGAQAIPVTDTTGTTWALWTGAAADGSGTVVKAARLAGAAPGGTVVISGAGAGAGLDDAAAGPRGAIAASFTTLPAAAGTTSVVLKDAAGAFGAPDVVTPAGASAIPGSRVAYTFGTSEPVVAVPSVGADRVQRVDAAIGPPV